MDTQHQANILRTYVNDMIAVESDVSQAITGQLDDDKVHEEPAVYMLLKELADTSRARLAKLENLSEALDGKLGAMVKEAVATTTGYLAGLYGMVRKHPVSKMLRDDQVALNLTATGYSMLYTTAVTFDHEDVAVLALEHLNEILPQFVRVTRQIPSVVVMELSEGIPNADAEDLATEAIEDAWMEAWDQDAEVLNVIL